MTLQDRDRRALILLAVAGVIITGWWIGSGDGSAPRVVAAVQDIPSAERRLTRLRQVTSAVPGRQQVLAQATKELATRESGLINADTAAQAQAQLLQVLVRLGRKQSPPIDMRNTEIGQVRPFGENYGEVIVAINFESGIEQLINFMSDITAQKELIATTDLRIGTANQKVKTMPVRLTVSGLVRRDLLPAKKGSGAT